MTRLGRAVLIAGVLLTAVGWLIDNRMWIALGISAISFIVVVRLVLGRTPRLHCEVRYPAREVHAGDDASLTIRLSMAHGAWLSKRLQIEADPLPPTTIDIRRARQPADSVLVIPTTRRGLVKVPSIVITYGDPWGMFFRQVARADGMEILVYPRLADVSVPDLQGFIDAQSLQMSQGDDDFHALREYVLGDEPRHIHWRSSARLGQLVVRQHVAAAGMQVVVLLDNRASAYSGPDAATQEVAFDRMVERTAGVVDAMARRRLPFALLTTDGSVSIAHAVGQPIELLMRRLALVQTSTNLGFACAEELRKLRASTILLVSPEPSWARQVIPSQVAVRVVGEGAQRTKAAA